MNNVYLNLLSHSSYPTFFALSMIHLHRGRISSNFTRVAHDSRNLMLRESRESHATLTNSCCKSRLPLLLQYNIKDRLTLFGKFVTIQCIVLILFLVGSVFFIASLWSDNIGYFDYRTFIGRYCFEHDL